MHMISKTVLKMIAQVFVEEYELVIERRAGSRFPQLIFRKRTREKNAVDRSAEKGQQNSTG